MLSTDAVNIHQDQRKSSERLMASLGSLSPRAHIIKLFLSNSEHIEAWFTRAEASTIELTGCLLYGKVEEFIIIFPLYTD